MNQPASHLDKTRLNNLAEEIWKSAERLRGKFRAHEYQTVILPIITIRRLECVLLKWREERAEEIRAKRPEISEEDLARQIKCLSINKLLAIFQPQAKIRLKPSNNGGLNGTHQNLGNFGCILGDR